MSLLLRGGTLLPLKDSPRPMWGDLLVSGTRIGGLGQVIPPPDTEVVDISGCVVMPGAHNAATARLIERCGFPGVYVSGAGLANATAGVPDIGWLTLTEVAQLAGYIAGAVQ